MWWLLGEILFCLLIAFLLGLLIGWLLCKLFSDKDREPVGVSDTKKRTELEAALNACKKRGTELEAELKLAQERAEGMAGAIDATSAAFAFAAGTASAAADEEPDPDPPKIAAVAVPIPAPKTPKAPKAAKKSSKDDLKKIWGIGKKIEELLNKNGIHTFAQVAETAETRFREILLASGNKRLHQIANEETWAEQAKMAARGDWDALKAFQAKLSWRDGGKAK